MKPTSPENGSSSRPSIFLIGTGVVGRAILRAHTDAGVSVCVADQDEQSLAQAIEQLRLDPDRWRVSERICSWGTDCP